MKKITFLSLALLSGLSLGTIAQAHGYGGPRPAFEEVDADGNGEITQDEMRALGETRRAARFDDADTDGDGFLTAAELTQASQANFEARSARMIERMDADGDGQISRDEMDARMERRGERFHRGDDDDDRGHHGGRMGDHDERAERGGHHGGAGRGIGGWAFNRADADGNGSLDATEWDSMGQRRGRD
ncbi:Ca2+-binding protein, EF-hand superfamily [Jannaschia faecimaris]|uniref:Ca2+-binding protein, EF-hand superfamily n=1 Tax=Jannaschia faecimaris TaxID=1244108 RepID=A0A1H3RE43_9RHOB|nr:EF-hand domain-containing protein [Jannaschia faecimaris]SDZ23833.1 Ca2+-binding protein, EF-hand superfamily [Jannaschia faecimaris]